MKILLLIISLIVFSSFTYSQNDHNTIDSTKNKMAPTSAPESLQKFFHNLIEDEKVDSEKDIVVEIDGLLFDETLTKSGRDFYDLFYNNWVAPPQSKNYSIFIKEKPFRMFTTIVEVKINETMVFQSILQPRYAYIENLSQQAIDRVSRMLANYDEIMRQLDGDDKSGTGIY